MARSLTPRDIHALMNQLVEQATGQPVETEVVDASTFVSAGELVMATGTENVLNSLSIVLGRTFMAVRPYKAKLAIINALNTDMYTNRMRKISFYSRKALASGDFNTQLYTNLAKGYTNGKNEDASTASMWEQNPAIPLEMNFAGQSTWEDSTTQYEYQLKTVFRDENEFNKFVSGIMIEKANDIESQKEAFNRMTILNHIAGVYDLDKANPNGRVINLTKAYNDKFGTAYTSEQLRTTYLKEFLAFFVATFKMESKYMTTRSLAYHWSPAKTVGDEDYYLLRHTPYNRQKVMLYEPLFVEATAQVLPEIFNPEYLDIKTQYEGVDYWQFFKSPAIDFVPAIPDVSTGVQTAGAEVNLPYVVGMIFDEDAIMIDYQLEDASSTPLEARKHYRNLWWTFSKNAICDFSENSCIFIMEDESETPDLSGSKVSITGKTTKK